MAKKYSCEGCSLCCRYIAIEIDKPESKDDFDQIRWFLLHKNVWVFIDHDDSWNVQFNTSCEKLDKKGMCTIYPKRPKICKDYSTKSCEKWGSGPSFKVLWKNENEFLEWLSKNNP